LISLLDGADACRWCGRGFVSRRRGSPQTFCSTACRSAFHSACRRRTEREFAAGRLTVGDIRDQFAKACTLPRGAGELSPPPSEEPDVRALAEALRTICKSVTVRVSVAPEGVAGLIKLGWLDVPRMGSPTALANAVVDIADAALDAGLPPK
jgi:hypothetical protein